MTEEPLVDVPAAATYLNVSPSTVRRLVKTGELSARRVGCQLRFERADLLAYSGVVETLAQAHVGFDYRAARAALRYDDVWPRHRGVSTAAGPGVRRAPRATRRARPALTGHAGAW